MSKRFGQALNGVAEPHRRENHVGRVSTVGEGGRSISVSNMNNSQLRNLVPIMPYGISSSPPSGLMSFVLMSDGSGKDGIVGVYDPNKPPCNPGDSMLYSLGGARFHCKGDKALINNRDTLEEIDNLLKMLNDLSKKVDNLSDKVDDISRRIGLY